MGHVTVEGMGLFATVFGGAKRRIEPYGLYAADAAQLDALVARGGDIGGQRESEFFLSFASERRLRAAADDVRLARRDQALHHEVVEPSHDVPEWMLFVRGYGQPLVPDFLRETIDYCLDLASRHGGTYEGWAGLLTPEEKDRL